MLSLRWQIVTANCKLYDLSKKKGFPWKLQHFLTTYSTFPCQKCENSQKRGWTVPKRFIDKCVSAAVGPFRPHHHPNYKAHWFVFYGAMDCQLFFLLTLSLPKEDVKTVYFKFLRIISTYIFIVVRGNAHEASPCFLTKTIFQQHLFSSHMRNLAWTEMTMKYG